MCPAHRESYTAALSYTEGHNKSDIKTKKKMIVGLLGTFTINTVILPLPLYIYVSSSLRKYIAFLMIAIFKYFVGQKNIDSHSYLQM